MEEPKQGTEPTPEEAAAPAEQPRAAVTIKAPVAFEYSIELLGKTEQTWVHTDALGYEHLYPTRCSVCLEPATKKELFTGDPLYKRTLCDKCSGIRPAQTDRLKMSARQELKLIASAQRFTLDKVTSVPRVAELHRIAQRERHPFACVPKPPKKGHMSKRIQTAKNTMLNIFRRLIAPRIAVGRALAESKGEEFTSLPLEVMGEVGAHAGRLAFFYLTRQAAVRKSRRNRTQQFSRRVNAGLTPGNTNQRKYIGS